MGGSQELATEVADMESGLEDVEQPRLAVCLVSGGMDSCVTAAIAHEENDALAFLHVAYGQRTEKREREAFEAIRTDLEAISKLLIRDLFPRQPGRPPSGKQP